MALVYSGLSDVIDDDELLYFGEEYSQEIIDCPEEEMERERKAKERRAVLKARGKTNV